MADTENKITVNCVMTEKSFRSFSGEIARFHHGLKEDIDLRHIEKAEGREFIHNSGIYVVDSPELIPGLSYLYYKKCILYLFTSDVADTGEWIRNPLMDGIVLESGDTTIKTFLEDTINHEYRAAEEKYRKSVAGWLSLANGPGNARMLTVSYGKIRRIYNELKHFVEYRNLREKYDRQTQRKSYSSFIETLYAADALPDAPERRDRISKALRKLENEVEVLKKEGVRTVSILLTGETGVGKSLLAECFQLFFLGKQTAAEEKPNKLNCSHLTREQVRIELFGALRGTYTDQTQTIPGRILENAMRVFILDEIADMDLELQPQLLSYLDDSRIQLQNIDQPVFCPLIFIATTNRDIPALVSQGKFRNDLYERFDLHLHIPPIRERREEVKPFIKAMFASERESHPVIFEELFISKALIEHLKELDYRDGNFRELQRIVRKAVRNCISRGERTIKIAHLLESD